MTEKGAETELEAIHQKAVRSKELVKEIDEAEKEMERFFPMFSTIIATLDSTSKPDLLKKATKNLRGAEASVINVQMKNARLQLKLADFRKALALIESRLPAGHEAEVEEVRNIIDSLERQATYSNTLMLTWNNYFQRNSEILAFEYAELREESQRNHQNRIEKYGLIITFLIGAFTIISIVLDLLRAFKII